MRKYFVIIFIFLKITSSYAKSSDICTGKMFNPLTDLDWECLMPISIGDVKLTSSPGKPDIKNPSSPLCVCQKGPTPQVGVTIGFWEPIRMVDVTKRPFCMVNMGGKKMLPEGLNIIGTTSEDNDTDNVANWHIHWYIHPSTFILNLIMDSACVESSGFDLAYLTEIDPIYNDDELSFLINPEAILFANPIAQAACAADCIASSIYKPLDFMFWCAGCHGGLYPFSINHNSHYTPIQSTSLAIEKFMAKLHRQMMLWVTSGEEALCHPIPSPVIKKSQYRLQTTYPRVGKGGAFSCNPFGRTTAPHEMFKEIPIKGEDFGYFVWRKRNCCLF